MSETPSDDTGEETDTSEFDAEDAFDDDEFEEGGSGGARKELQKTKQRLEEEADRAVSEFDEGVVDLLAWLLDTETRARIYVYLRQNPHSTSDEIADGTGLYPSTVREAVADLHEEDTVRRQKRDSDSAGNNPYEYEAIAPSNLVRGVVGQVQRELNTVFNLEDRFGDDDDDCGPVTITVDGDESDSDDAGDDATDEDAVEIDIEDAEAEDDMSEDGDGDDEKDN
ncbi:ArsR family transcriptional regulator [Halonotius terrestris]|uniref:ArsR family transcriptional regulator n=1 Tax=Halonotius terrestris TaxID=2487750 RepID=A0A8J8PAU2_9EURY|nr:winged helix-turn-helix domain-containing protein [Halonotius terrestris]TQQ79825.1 ArsR family transcriptional regulator [Halonotius terrestris]